MTDITEDKRSLVKTAFIYSQEGKWNRAIEAYEKIVALDPVDYNAFNALGDMYSKRGLFLEAFTNYSRAADGYEKTGNSHRAAGVYRKGARLDLTGVDRETKERQDLVTRISQAVDAMESGENDQALKILEDARRQYPQSLVVKQRIAEIFAEKMMATEAAELYWELTEHCLANNDTAQALKTAQRVLSLTPDHPQAKAVIEKIYPGTP